MANEDQTLIRTSERLAFRRCPQRWWWAFRMGLKGKGKPADALWFGTGAHISLAEWYGEGFDRGAEPDRTFEHWVGDELRYIKANLTERDRDWFDEPVYIEAKELGREVFRAYLREYGEDPDLEILAIEQPFEVDLEDAMGEYIATFAGTFDGVELDHTDGLIYLIENKTAASIRTAHLAMDDQAGGYFAAATVVLRAQGILSAKEAISGIMYNFLRKAKPDPRPRNEAGAYLNMDGRVSKRQPPPGFHREWVDRSPREVRTQLQRIADEVEIMNKMVSGEIKVTKSITFTCPSCPFFTMCQLHERGGRAWEEFRAAEFRTEDPYKDHRKSAAEEAIALCQRQ
jgi:hypothetical protein